MTAVCCAEAAPGQALEVFVSDAGNFNNPPWRILKFDGGGDNPVVFIDDELDWDSEGHLCASSYTGDSVREFDPDGKDLGLFIDSDLAGPTNIWFEASGDLLVVDYDGTAVKRFDATGAHQGDFMTGLSLAEGVAVLPTGEHLIGNGADSTVKRFGGNGSFIDDFVTSGAGNLLTPNAIVVRGGTATLDAAFEVETNGLTAVFTDRSSGRPDSWTWDFGDGTSSGDQSPHHTYTTDGTFGQALPGIPAAQLIHEGDRRRVIFLTENADFRSNLGLANATGDPLIVRWERFASDGHSIDAGTTALAPWSNVQLNRVLQDVAPVTAAFVDVWTDTPGGAFAAYGSVLDNLTSDPTTVLPQ